MIFYFDELTLSEESSMELLTQSHSDYKIFNPISGSRCPISGMDSFSGSVSMNWNEGSASMLDSFFQGIAEGGQQWAQLKEKFGQDLNTVIANQNSEHFEDTVEGKKNGREAQRKAYSASMFYKKYDGSNVSLTVNPEFIFLTTSSASPAVSKAVNVMSYISPDFIAQAGNGSQAFEAPPNGYWNSRQGMGPDSYRGTFGLRVGSGIRLEYMLIDGFTIDVSSQLCKLESGSLTPLYVKLKISMTPAGKIPAGDLYEMLTGVKVRTVAWRENKGYEKPI